MWNKGKMTRTWPGTHTVYWGSFCLEVCEIELMEDSGSIGGEGKMMQIDKSNAGF